MNRETVYSALFKQLQGATGFTTIGRRLKHGADLPANSMLPALYQIQKRENLGQSRGLPAKNMFEVDLYVYASIPDHSLPPAATLNPLIEAVENILAFDPITGTQTLNGTVSHCWITTVEYFEGVQDSLSVAIISVEILTNL